MASTLTFRTATGDIVIPLPDEWKSEPVAVRHEDGSSSYEHVVTLHYRGTSAVLETKAEPDA